MVAQIASIVTSDRDKFIRLLGSWGVAADAARLEDCGRPVDHPPGATIFDQNQTADSLFWICRGVITVHRNFEDGSRVLMRVLGRGDLLGMSDRRNDKGQWIHSFSAAALSSCTLRAIPRAQMHRLVGSLPSNDFVSFIEQLNAQWTEWVDSCGRFLGLTFRERLDDVFFQLGSKFGTRDKTGVTLTFDLSHADLAEMIGSSASLVRRLVTDLKNEGELARRGSRYILLKGGSVASRVMRESARHNFASTRRALSA